jgi:replicative DNA helicase
MSTFSLDLSVLRLLKDRKKFERYANVIPDGTINRETAALVKRFGEYFKATDADQVRHAEFWPFLRTRYPNWKEKDTEFWYALTKPIDLPNPLGLEEQIITNLLTKDLSNQALDYIEKWQAGGEVELGEALRQSVERYDAALQRKVKTPLIELGWDDMIEEETHDTGLHWRLRALRESTRALRPGDYGIIAMRPDRGKTTLVAGEVTYFAPQLVELYPDEVRPVVWFNNEGPGRRIVSRLRQSALGMSVREIVELGPQEAQRRYIEALGGREDMIRVIDIHGFSSYEVEDLIRKHRPGVAVFDMVDNIRFAGATINGGERTDQILEAMYGATREWCVKYDMVGIATSQLSAAAEGVKFPPQTDLKDSRTGKQGACDFIITGGVDNNQPNTRYIGFTKNKIKREGAKYSPNAAYFFDADRGRLVEPEDE